MSFCNPTSFLWYHRFWNCFRLQTKFGPGNVFTFSHSCFFCPYGWGRGPAYTGGLHPGGRGLASGVCLQGAASAEAFAYAGGGQTPRVCIQVCVGRVLSGLHPGGVFIWARVGQTLPPPPN